jgi:hypothetical protein
MNSAESKEIREKLVPFYTGSGIVIPNAILATFGPEPRRYIALTQ